MNKLKYIATIGYCYWRLNNIYEQLSKLKSNIEILVDIACGYNEMEEARKLSVRIIREIASSLIS